jgi:thiamine biosynthesis lipoprotein
MARVGYKHIRLDPSHQTVRFLRPGMEIDPGGIGKGYAVDRMVETLRSNGLRSAMISAGGSSIYAFGSPPEQHGWKVKIRDPRSAAKTVAEVSLHDESMSTSGTSEKFFMAGGRLYSHIFDPRTGYPATGTLSVSVIAPKTMDSEAWTKPFFIRGSDWAARHKPAGFRVYFCEDKVEQACEWLQ